MGEVYRARDTRLKRDVAIKVLPDTFAHDADRLARLQREAELLATLNHPNIAGIYGFEESNGMRALVLELVEGPTLADRIARGAIPLDEALLVARQIADALEAAHEQSIIHRDLKPANIKLRPDGVVKVLDFGLAKLVEAPAASSASGLSQSPTITTPAMMTGVGMILGTAAYMSPEQAKGRPADKRSDVWAFGCVLYEMLAGRRAFEGEDVSDTLAQVLKSEPQWMALPSAAQPALRRLLRRCLTKDRKQRLSELGTARMEIDDALHPSSDTIDVGGRTAANRGRERLAWTAAGVLLLATLALGAVVYMRRVSTGLAPELRVAITTPADSDVYRFALSPDGEKLVYAQAGALWLRSLASEIPQRLTEGGDFPFWSPDSQSIGFFHGGQLRRFDLSSGLLQMLAKAPIGIGGTWSADGTILYVPSHSSPAWRISAGGGGAQPSKLATGQVGHRFPRFLPDGRHFLYLAMGTVDVRGIYVGSLDSPETHRLFASETQAIFAPPDSILYQRQGALLAQRIDLRTFKLVGDAVPVAPRVAVIAGNYNAIAVTASATGRLAYRPSDGFHQLVWLDRKGQRLASLGDPDDLRPYNARLSPDGRALAVDRTTEGDVDVWVVDTERGTRRRLTHDPVREAAAAWSPDGHRIAFASERSGVFAIHEMSVDGSGGETVLSSSSEPRLPRDWSSDGRFLLFLQQSPDGGDNDWVLPLAGDRRPMPIAETTVRAAQSRFSPDSRWIAYQSSETGRSEVYIRPFPGSGAALQVSTKGGSVPRWQRDDHALVYLDRNQVMSVPFALGSDVPTAGEPIVLFQLGARRLLDISPDGQRFLILEGTAPPTPITLILNWAGPHR
jgi:Tol biopolymer transport system component